MPRPLIQIDDVIREMNDDEFANHQLRQLKQKELNEAIEAKKLKRETALAKLEALGLDENDLKALGL